MADPYHGLVADYEWIFDDGEMAGGAAVNQPATARLPLLPWHTKPLGL